MLTYLNTFEEFYEDCALKSGLTINDVGRTFLLLDRSGVSPQRLDQLKMQHNGDLSQYDSYIRILRRMAQQEGGTAHHSSHTYPILYIMKKTAKARMVQA